jgi:hypothetical protein
MEQIKNCPEPEQAKLGQRPTAEEAAQRLVILKYVAVRAITAAPRDILHIMLKQLAADAREDFTRYAETEREEFWQGLLEGGLQGSLSAWEQQFASTTLITMTHEEQVDASWLVESIQTLMWALGLLSQLPPYDTQADHDLLKSIPSADVAGFIRSQYLRPDAEIDRARGTAELWHWRARTRLLIECDEVQPDENLKALGFHSFDEIVRFSAHMAAAEGTIPACIGEDFPAFGRAYRDLSEHEWSVVRSISIRRHFTLNWLCGYAPENRWDETPTET